MQVAILLFERFTALDAVGPYDVLSRIPGTEVVLAAERAGPVGNEVGGLALTATATLADVPHPDVIVVPGGPGQTDHMTDGPVHRWLRAAESAGIDMALELTSRIADATVAQAVQLGIEYDPRPPFAAGSPHAAPPEVVAVVQAYRNFILTGVH